MASDKDIRRDRIFPSAVIALGVIAALLRIAAARGELWFDEIWTIQGVQAAVRTPVDIVLAVKHDNNHFLNSFVVYLIGPNAAAWVYRFPAVIAGTLTVILAGWIQRRRGSVEVLTALVLCGFSFALVNYSSEARGYAYEMFFALAAVGILCWLDERPSIGWECAFSLTCILGFLAQPLFIAVYLAAQVSTWLPLGRRQTPRRWILSWETIAFRTMIPGLFFAWLYWVNWSQAISGGGNSQPYLTVVVETLSLAIGGPQSRPGVYFASAVSVLLTCAAFWNCFQRAPRRAVFYLNVTVVFPALILLIVPRDDIYPRYFLISVLFLLMLWSDYLGDVCLRFPSGRVWTAVALAVFVCANGWHISELIVLGRGHYQEVIQTIEQQTQAERAVVLVDHPNRQEAMIDFYAGRMSLFKPMEVFPMSAEPSEAAEWLLMHSLDAEVAPPDIVTTPKGVAFRLVQAYPYTGLSGWQLDLYKRASASK